MVEVIQKMQFKVMKIINESKLVALGCFENIRPDFNRFYAEIENFENSIDWFDHPLSGNIRKIFAYSIDRKKFFANETLDKRCPTIRIFKNDVDKPWIGNIHLERGPVRNDKYSTSRCARITYNINLRWRGHGYATESMRLLSQASYPMLGV